MNAASLLKRSVGTSINGSGLFCRDRELRIWNLLKGKVTYHSRLATEASAVAFAPGGVAYALVCGRDASLHAAEGSGV